MPDVVWPAQLQQYVNQDGFTYTFGETVIRSDNDIGLSKVRRVSTRPVDVIAFQINLPYSDYTSFSHFYNTTVNGGATRFIFKHPVSREDLFVRFLRPPVMTPLGGRVFNISLEVEVLP